MNVQSKALRLADALSGVLYSAGDVVSASRELRRLHAENERDTALLRQALEAFERCVATCFDECSHAEVMSRPEHFANQTIAALRERLGEGK